MNKFITILVCFSCIFMNFQPFRIYFDGGQAISMLIPTIVIIINDNFFKNKSFVLASVYACLVLLLRMSGVEYFQGYLSELMAIFFSISAFEHFRITKDYEYGKSVLFSYYGSLFVISLMSIPQFILFPGLSRAIIAASNEGTTVPDLYFWTIAYSSLHKIQLIIIPILVMLKYGGIKKSMRIALLLSLLIFFTTILLGDCTTPLLLYIITIIAVFILNKNYSFLENLKKHFLLIILCLTLLNKTVIITILLFLQPVFEGTTNFTKINDLIYQIETGNTDDNSDLGHRENLYTVSIDTFLNNPLGVEKNMDKIGQHSYILDHLAVLGIILIIPYFVLLFYIFKNQSKLFRDYKLFYILAIISTIFLAYYKNFFQYIEAWFIIPMFLLIFENITYFKKNDYECIIKKSA